MPFIKAIFPFQNYVKSNIDENIPKTCKESKATKRTKGNESQVLKWRIERPLRLRFSMSVARTQKEITYQRRRRKHCEEREKHRDTPRSAARTVILWVL
jgi:hypothetical protein